MPQFNASNISGENCIMMYGPSPSALSRQDKSKSSEQRARGGADYARRLRAAGLDPEGNKMPENMDEFRNEFARRIHMFINKWDGCPERICRRQQGCMAPKISCSNYEELSPEEADRQWRKAQPDIYKTLKAEMARRDVYD
jgi:hypothetical protein